MQLIRNRISRKTPAVNVSMHLEIPHPIKLFCVLLSLHLTKKRSKQERCKNRGLFPPPEVTAQANSNRAKWKFIKMLLLGP